MKEKWFWLNVSHFYQVTNPASQFVQVQVKSDTNDTAIAQASLQIIKMGC